MLYMFKLLIASINIEKGKDIYSY